MYVCSRDCWKDFCINFFIGFAYLLGLVLLGLAYLLVCIGHEALIGGFAGQNHVEDEIVPEEVQERPKRRQRKRRPVTIHHHYSRTQYFIIHTLRNEAYSHFDTQFVDH